MQRHKKNGLEWLTFELLDNVKGLVHAVFTKKGGSNPAIGLNLGLHTIDEPTHLQKNFDLIKDSLNLKRVTAAYQMHGIHTTLVTESHPSYISKCDSLLTASKNHALFISHADCQAAIFYDPIHHALANVHSGWRGSVQNIYKATIHAMKKHFQSDPKDLLVCISPSLGPNFAEFINYKSEFPEAFWPFQIKENYFDFWEISKEQLKSCGVLKSHIQVAQLCTVTEEEDFYSYRRQTKEFGKGPLKAANGTLAMLY
ncbi:MAG: peptidoglycan editing factor PgeF [Chlamydiales bacterium]|nr:peptidoglycan editing factor PgeF [Chlamydiales bacterium]